MEVLSTRIFEYKRRHFAIHGAWRGGEGKEEEEFVILYDPHEPGHWASHISPPFCLTFLAHFPIYYHFRGYSAHTYTMKIPADLNLDAVSFLTLFSDPQVLHLNVFFPSFYFGPAWMFISLIFKIIPSATVCIYIQIWRCRVHFRWK